MDIFTAAREFGVFQSGLIMGILLGAVRDALRIVRTLLPCGKIIVFIEDLLYTLFFGLVMFAFSVGTVGEIRYYIAAAFAAGFAAERFAAGKFAVRTAESFSEVFREKIIGKAVTKMLNLFKKSKSLFVESD